MLRYRDVIYTTVLRGTYPLVGLASRYMRPSLSMESKCGKRTDAPKFLLLSVDFSPFWSYTQNLNTVRIQHPRGIANHSDLASALYNTTQQYVC